MSFHIRTICAPTEKLKCPHCEYSHAFRRNLRIHIQNVHTKIKQKDYKTCDRCGQAFRLRISLMNHVRRCGKESSYQCKLCPYNTALKTRFEGHLQNHVIHGDVKVASNDGIEARSMTHFVKIFFMFNDFCSNIEFGCNPCKYWPEQKLLSNNNELVVISNF